MTRSSGWQPGHVWWRWAHYLDHNHFSLSWDVHAFHSWMMTSSNGNIFRVTGPLCGEFTGPGEFPAQRPVTRSFDVFFDLRLNKRLSKQPWGWWLETPSWSLWRHCNVLNVYHITYSVDLWCPKWLNNNDKSITYLWERWAGSFVYTKIRTNTIKFDPPSGNISAFKKISVIFHMINS